MREPPIRRLLDRVVVRNKKKRPPRSFKAVVLATWAPLVVRVVLAVYDHAGHVVVLYC